MWCPIQHRHPLQWSIPSYNGVAMTILLGADTECLRSRRSVAKGCLGRQGTPRTPRDTSDAEGRLGCQGVPRARASLDRARRARAKIATERLATTRRYHQTATRTHLQPRAHARTHTHTHMHAHTPSRRYVTSSPPRLRFHFRGCDTLAVSPCFQPSDWLVPTSVDMYRSL